MPTTRLLELNVRTWLRLLSAKASRPVNLDCVPAEEFERWQSLGLTHLWLMGVWPTGALSRRHALDSEALREVFTAVNPRWTHSDVGGSPYAIADYSVPRALGGNAALARFRQRLNDHGIRLVLDFVPNHVGLDHPWVHEHPEWFMAVTPPAATGTTRRKSSSSAGDSRSRASEARRFITAAGPRWLAHGRDPYFAPWADTVQVDIRQPGARGALMATLRSLVTICDGVRCDMAMLLLQEVFDRTWPRAETQEPAAASEFWEEAIQATKAVRPDFQFLGEVYWDLEARLQSLGFDYTYDKRLYDSLVRQEPVDVCRHVVQVGGEFLGRSMHFLENHDEPRAASLMSLEAQRAATILVLALPGLCLLHEGQIDGVRVRQPIQLSLPVDDAGVDSIRVMHRELADALREAGVGMTDARVLTPKPAWDGNPTWQSFAVLLLQPGVDRLELVVVNLASHRAQCYVPLEQGAVKHRNWRLEDRLGPERHERHGEDLLSPGLYLDVPGHAAQVFAMTPLA